jgi:MerR family transcriptional regulator, thiopeptide resistance regulator
MSFSVGQVAEMAGVTVRTLHHYDDVGLLTPSTRSSTGYRKYSSVDLDRLHQILMYRALGFSLEQIRILVDDGESDSTSHLRRQHELLLNRIEQLRAMAVAVERALEAEQMGISLTPEERFEVFGDFDPADYADEAEQKWGGTDAYRQSKRRTSAYSKADWQRIRAENQDIENRMVAALKAGVEPDSTAAVALAEEHRSSISRWFYDCPPAMHRGLADMYLADARFTSHYEKLAAGLAQWVHDAIHAQAGPV